MSDLILSIDAQKNAWDFANKICKSSLVPMAFRGKVEDTFVAILRGQELGLSSLMALDAICVIQGTVTLKVQTMLAIVRAKDPSGTMNFSVDNEKRLVKAYGKSGNVEFESVWDWNRVQMLGLDTKDNYRKQPLTMMKARATSEMIRTVWPHLLNGMYSTEEVQDLPPVVTNDEFKSMVDEDFPIPENEKEIGSPEYRVQNALFRGKQLKDIDVDEMAEYREKLMVRTTKKKDWEIELISSMGIYLSSLEPRNLGE